MIYSRTQDLCSHLRSSKSVTGSVMKYYVPAMLSILYTKKRRG